MDAFIQPTLFQPSPTKSSTATISQQHETSFQDRISTVGGVKLSAWNGYGLGYRVPVVLSSVDLSLGKQISDFAPTLFGAAREKWRKEGLDFRQFQPNIEELEKEWGLLFKGVGDYGLPTYSRIECFKKSADRAIKEARERNVYLAQLDHPLNMIRSAGSALNFLYAVHSALIFEGRFSANYILTRAQAGISDASTRFSKVLNTKGARWFNDFKESVSTGTEFYSLLCGETLAGKDWNTPKLDPLIRPISETMANDASFDHPKFKKLTQVIRQLKREEASEGVIVLAGGGIETQRLAQQLHRVFPSVNVQALHGQSGRKIENEYIGDFNNGTCPLLVTDEKMIKRLDVKTAKLLVVYSALPHQKLSKDLIPKAEENVQFVFRKPD